MSRRDNFVLVWLSAVVGASCVLETHAAWSPVLLPETASSGFRGPMERKLHRAHPDAAESVDKNADQKVQKEDEDCGSSKFLLPIFPLRKSVRVPTQTMRLNLYEERYLALAEYVLYQQEQQEQEATNSRIRRSSPLFGAWYSSHKSQIVPQGGMGPITPLIEVGDTGVVFRVVDSWDSAAHNAANRTEATARKISLETVGVCRFRVEKLLHDGCGNLGNTENTTDDPLPFILVEATQLNDDPVQDHLDQETSMASEQQLHQFLLHMQNAKEDKPNAAGLPWKLFAPESGLKREGKDHASSKLTTTERILQQAMDPSHDIVYLYRNTLEKDTMQEYKKESTCRIQEARRREYFCFAALTALSDYGIPPPPPTEMEQLLTMRATNERLSWIWKRAKNKKGFAALLIPFFRAVQQAIP